VPDGHFAVLDQVGNHRLGAIHAQLLVHGGGARGVSKTLHRDDVASGANGIFRQLLESSFVVRRDYRFPDGEVDLNIGLSVVLAQLGETFRSVLDLLLIG
jgi:hypothetical protein